MKHKIKEFNDEVKRNHNKADVFSRLLDIQSELGELSKEVLKSSDYGIKEFTINNNFKMELGDVFYSVFTLCYELDIDADTCLDMAIEKMKKRFDNKKNISSLD